MTNQPNDRSDPTPAADLDRATLIADVNRLRAKVLAVKASGVLLEGDPPRIVIPYDVWRACCDE